MSITRRIYLVALLVGLPVIPGRAQPSAQPFPGPDEPVLWQAEAVAGDGWRKVEDPAAAGGAYVESTAPGPRLEFTCEVAEPTTLRVRPVWWRNGDQTPATRYPYPFEPATGPDALVAVGGRVFFIAPTAARVGVIDAATEKLERVIDVGGYVSDLVADPERGRVYVADSIGNRVVVVDAAALNIVGEIPTPAEPWSLAVGQGNLYVACRQGRCLLRIGADGTPGEPVALAAEPAGVEWLGDPGRLVVRFVPLVIQPVTMEPIPADDLGYGWSWHTSATINRDLWVDSPKNGVLRLNPRGQTAEEIDVSAVTGDGAMPAGTTGLLAVRRSPDNLVANGNLIYFTSPCSGRLGVFDVTEKKITQTVELGGIPVDLEFSPNRDKLYVTDAGAHKVHILDLKTLAALGSIDVAEEPVAIRGVKDVAIQRPENERPAVVQKMFVVSRAGRTLTAIDALTDEVVRTFELPLPARRVLEVPVAASGWWGPITIERVPQRLTPKVAVELSPAWYDADLKPAELTGELGGNLPRRTTVKATAGGAEKTFVATDYHLLRVDNARWIDTTAATDPQLAPPPPLRPTDRPGAITLAVDDGPEYDWMRGVWNAPDTQMYLIGDSEEFWRWNAQTFRLQPGRHTIRVTAHRPLARLDAIEVARDSRSAVRVEVHPEPREVHDSVPLYGYSGVFYDAEPVRFGISATNQTDRPETARLDWLVLNYMAEPVARGSRELSLKAGESVAIDLPLELPDHGRHHLTLTLHTPNGRFVQDHYFLRLPKLEHPRLFFRRDDIPEIRARIAAHPELFARYKEWLTRKLSTEGERFPEMFMPNTLDAGELQKLAPVGYKGQFGWRNYELAWRFLGVQFAAVLLGDETGLFQRKLQPLLDSASTSYYCMYHHHGPYFPGAAAGLWDMAPDSIREQSPLKPFFAKYIGDMNVMPWMLAAIEEPLTPDKRALVYKLMTWQNNADLYFESHVGRRAGKWWQNPWTGCHCQNHGLLLSSLYFKNFFDEPRLYEKRMFQGFFTYLRYADPLQDKRRLLPATRGPLGEPTRWLQAALSRNPLEKALYAWDGWMTRAEGPLEGEREKQIDELFELKGMPLVGGLGGGVHHFVTGVHVPVAVALGWYDPAAPVTPREELPETILCDQDGWVPMRSDWGDNATEVTFVCGHRDHTSREHPPHFTIVKAGEYLVGSPALQGDDGNNTCSWSNSVVVDDEWIANWRTNIMHPRDGEYWVINRFSQPTWKYISRDRATIGYSPAESGWGGGLDLHGHTQTCYLREGQVIGYRTSPAFDYVAGDASNAWPIEKVAEYTRQLVYLRPDTVVVYDRIRLGPAGNAARWVATVADLPKTDGSSFRVIRPGVELNGTFLLPEQVTFTAPEPYYGWIWKGQRPMEVIPATQPREQEYLAVLRVSTGSPAGVPVLPRGSAGWRVSAAYPTSEPPKDAAGREWFQPDYEPAGEWLEATAPFGYDSDPQMTIATRIPDNDGHYFTRRTLTLDAVPAGALVLRVASDNAARVWINGTLVDDDPAFTQPVGHEHQYWNREVPIPAGVLKPGNNVIAARIANEANSSDCSFDCEIAVLAEEPIGVEASRIEEGGRVGVELPAEGGPIRVLFDRHGPVGGSVALPGAAVVELPRQVDDTYRYWQSDPRYEKWAKEDRFRFVVLPGDLDRP